MEKKLPSVFAGTISKNSAHNRDMSYTSAVSEDRDVKSLKNNDMVEQNINQKINDIFSSTRYVYKADVNIKLKNETIKRKIIGKNSVHLITINNELIPIGDIVDIEFAD